MDCLFEQNVSQNTALSMELLHVTIIEYYKESKGVTGLKFPLAFLVLPMVLQRRTTPYIINKNLEVSIKHLQRIERFLSDFNIEWRFFTKKQCKQFL